MPNPRRLAVLFAVAGLAAPTDGRAQRLMEALGRGVVAVQQEDGRVFVGWRLLATDPDGVTFNVYRATAGGRPKRLNGKPGRTRP